MYWKYKRARLSYWKYSAQNGLLERGVLVPGQVRRALALVLSEGSEEKKNNAIASVLRVMVSELLRLQGSHKDLQAKDANRDSEIASLRDELREHVIQS